MKELFNILIIDSYLSELSAEKAPMLFAENSLTHGRRRNKILIEKKNLIEVKLHLPNYSFM